MTQFPHTWFTRIGRRIVFRSRRAQLDRELAEEIEFHRSLKERESVEPGVRPMGNITLAKEESREQWSFMTLERLFQDLSYAARLFARNPGFTLIAALSLALGIGGNAAMFSLVNALLIRPLPYFQPDRLVRITGTYPRAALVVLRQQSRAMDVASVSPGSEFNLTGQGEAVRLIGSLTSANLFPVLGAPVEMGRRFDSGEDLPGRDGVVILSHALWRNKFGGDRRIVGRMITLNGMKREVVGIMPASFSFPSPKVQLWVPTRLDPSDMVDYWGGEFVPLIGRLRPGASLQQARGEIRPLVNRLLRMFPFAMRRDWNTDATVISLQQDLTGEVRGKLLILLCSVGIVLLIACANVASLLLARATTRRREIALRAALGAGRARIVRQLLTESVLLAMIGGGLGILLGEWALLVFRPVLPLDTPGAAGASLDWHVGVFATALAVVTGVAFGIAPALSASRMDLTESIKTGSQRSTTGVWTRLRRWLIAAEVALTAVLVVSAGLLIRSLYALSQVNPGFRPAHILTIRISPNQASCKERASCVALYDQLLRRARGVSGVSDVAIANTVPLDGQLPTIPADIEGHPTTPEYPSPMLWAGAISPDYLQMMRIPVLEGRGFTDADGANSPAVLLVSAKTAQHFWPGQNPVGKHIHLAGDDQTIGGRTTWTWRTVVGVVGDVKQYKLADNLGWLDGAIYMPYPQSARYPRTVQGTQEIPAAMDLLVKTSADTARVGREMRQLAIDQNPDVPVDEVQTLEGIISASISDFRATMGVFISFAAVAILLAAIGIYGLVSYSVSQRTYEIGVRVAIGASKRSIVAMILGQSVRLTLIGLTAGVLAGIVFTRFLSSLLFGVAATDPVTFVAVSILLLAISVTAASAPAWRATQIDPAKSLRVD